MILLIAWATIKGMPQYVLHFRMEESNFIFFLHLFSAYMLMIIGPSKCLFYVLNEFDTQIW